MAGGVGGMITFRLYEPGDIFWLIRCNWVVFTDIKVAELNMGILGFGFVLQFSIHKPRL